MSKKNKALSIISLVALTLIGCSASFPALAQLYNAGSGGNVSLESVVLGAINATWIIFFGIGIIFILAAGALFLIANGEAEKLSKARSALLWGMGGVAVGIIAFSMFNLVKGIIT